MILTDPLPKILRERMLLEDPMSLTESFSVSRAPLMDNLSFSVSISLR